MPQWTEKPLPFHMPDAMQAEQNSCWLNELEVTHAGLTETEIFPTGRACFPSQPAQQVLSLKESS